MLMSRRMKPLANNKQTKTKKRNVCVWEPIWFYAIEVDYRSYSPTKMIAEEQWKEHMVFINLKRAYDRVHKETIWWVLNEK